MQGHDHAQPTADVQPAGHKHSHHMKPTRCMNVIGPKGAWPNWRLDLLELHDPTVGGGHIYEFGVYTGGSMGYMRACLLHCGAAPRRVTMWGFDSFQGLPGSATSDELKVGWKASFRSADPRSSPHWRAPPAQPEPGRPLICPCQAMHSNLSSGWDAERNYRHDVQWVQGWYDKLNDSIVHERGTRPAAYIDIDADLYVSSLAALDFMFRNSLVVVGTLVGYDDWMIVPCRIQLGSSAVLTVGEARAHAEITARYGVHFACVSGSCMCNGTAAVATSHGAIFKVLALGRAPGDTGYHPTALEYSRFMTKGRSGGC
mmetsp:Transcript_375/g.584  ORF Transcript_375/g.584 Transcript_375/m.584 type:complete len:315 (+) Transcript_375:152-1096(+)